ncbi:PREDICTED: inter-alpha-trypsin inhibitor heavy chain H3-like [Nanorana parkeri]|uniref:inter-alpha-trypsin inhibitor heavy chain H3-like n=1 Tax=Nanorana parkeri TaxID=125878 RepID=UPI0008545659|nr:PREDICTED: inter-alpha-trypsin inhibitor heavy chain H3-like [Nanorana parkeri]
MSRGQGTDIVIALLVVCGLRPSHGAPVESSMDLHRMDISCSVASRFARTLITTEIRNTGNSSQEAIFDVELPKTAFITNFSMTVDGATNVGVVKKKEDAGQQYERAVSRGESAGLVQSIGRKMENFRISVNVGARTTAVFKLTYEELLKRRHGSYEMEIKVRPKQLVENFQIDVDIFEPQEISFVDAHGTFITNELKDLIGISHYGNKAHIMFSPTVQQQRKCSVCSETLLDGDFIIKYDVKREKSAGNIQIVNGYFVHYFAPSSLARLPKNVVFVIDCSGSMRGRKLQQTFEAFTKILEDLPEEDHVGILKFNEDVSRWKQNLVKAAPENIKSAKEFVAQITARGGTNINSALLLAAEMLQNDRKSKVLPEISASIIVFLSDGDPTSGVTDLGEILKNVKAGMEGVAALYSLGFGTDVDYGFLEKMSLENGGLARRIYEDSDSALQLQNFYKEVAFPVLLDVSVQYPALQVNHLTQNSFNHYYQGSELVVAGHIDNNDIDVLTAQVTAQGASETFSMNVETNIREDAEIAREQRYAFGDFTERLWAYLTIEQLLTKLISAEGEEKGKITEEALRLCLKYSFVTPLTSMVITNPEDDNDGRKVVANKPKEDDNEPSVSTAKSKFSVLCSSSLAGYDSKPAEEKWLDRGSGAADGSEEEDIQKSRYVVVMMSSGAGPSDGDDVRAAVAVTYTLQRRWKEQDGRLTPEQKEVLTVNEVFLPETPFIVRIECEHRMKSRRVCDGVIECSQQISLSHYARISSIRRKVAGRRSSIVSGLVPERPLMVPVWNAVEETIKEPTAKISPEPDSTTVALISLPFVPDKIFLGIDETPDTWINLLHNPDRDITLNGRLAADGSSFARLGFVNRKKKISMDIAADNFTLFAAPNAQTYNWTSALQGVR